MEDPDTENEYLNKCLMSLHEKLEAVKDRGAGGVIEGDTMDKKEEVGDLWEIKHILIKPQLTAKYTNFCFNFEKVYKSHEKCNLH